MGGSRSAARYRERRQAESARADNRADTSIGCSSTRFCMGFDGQPVVDALAERGRSYFLAEISIRIRSKTRSGETGLN
jgi:hypothetical protein